MSAVYVTSNDHGSTLTTYVYVSFAMAWAAEKLGKKSYIYWPSHSNLSVTAYQDKAKFAAVPNQFDWYFKQPFFELGVVPPPEAAWSWQKCPELGQHSLMSQPLEVIRAWYQKHLHFSDVVVQRGQALVDKHKLDFKKTLGLTWRGTDCVLDGRQRQPIEVYFPFIDEVLKKEPDLRLACTAEETCVLDKLLARYPNAFVIDEFYMAPHGTKHNPERFSPVSGFERGLQPALMVWLFSQCAHYIKNRSSTGAVASWLSHGRIVCIAHAETLSYELFTDKAEIQGRRIPLTFPK